MDFIVELPTEKPGYKNILGVVDIYMKMANFVAITKIDTERTANALVQDI